MDHSTERRLKFLSFLIQLLAIYGGIGYAYARHMISPKLFFLMLCFGGLIFALFYAVRGSLAAVAGAGLTLWLCLSDDLLVFLSQRYTEVSFFLAALLLTGGIRSVLTDRAIGTDIVRELSERRIRKLTSELSQKDRALQDVFRHIMTHMESPVIIYQALRRLEDMAEGDFFQEVLDILYIHCHVEKSVVCKVSGGNRFRQVAAFGDTDLPDPLVWVSDQMPEILRVARTQKEVIIPRQVGHRMVMAMPILSASEELRYMLLIEEIRFINFNESLIELLKVTVFWLKYIIEDRFYREERLHLSAFRSVIVYRQEIAGRLVRRSIAHHKKYGLPFFLLRITGKFSEADVRKLADFLRLYDEIFMLREDQLVVLLSMADEKDVEEIAARLMTLLPDLTVRPLDVRDLSVG